MSGQKNATPTGNERPTVRDSLFGGGLESWKSDLQIAEYARKYAASQAIETVDVVVSRRACLLYIDGEWKALRNVTSESKVQHWHATEILGAIIDHFHQRPTTRPAVVTCNRYYQKGSDTGSWEGGTRRQPRISPNCMIMGCGSVVSGSMTLPSGVTIRYTDCITPVELDFDKGTSGDPTAHASVYSRQVLQLCHNCEHVYGVLLTGNWVQLISYDRNGLLRSAKVDIDKDPATFIGLVSGVSSHEDSKVSYVECLERRNCPLELQDMVLIILPYKNQIQPFFIRNSMHSRSSTCWHVQDTAASTLVAKFGWRFADRTPEWDALRDANGLDGVAQLYALFDGITNISQDHSCVAGDTDRVLSHTLMDGYGGRVEDFSSPKQLLCAIHDAVEGHMNLFLGCGLLHRDISTRTVFLGNSDNAGCRGAIIDWDLPTLVSHDPKASACFRKGTRVFQSARVLEEKPHDYWDDLESFFYVLTWTLATSKSDSAGQIESADLRKKFTKWDDDDDLNAVNAKLAFLVRSSISQPFLGKTAARDFLRLIDMLKDVIKLYAFVKEIEDAEFARKHGGRTTKYVRKVKRADIILEYNKFLQPIRDEIRRLDLGLPPPSPIIPTGSFIFTSPDPWNAVLNLPSQIVPAVDSPHGPDVSNSAAASSSEGSSKRPRGSAPTQPSKRARSSALQADSQAFPLPSPSVVPHHDTSSTNSLRRSGSKVSMGDISKLSKSSRQRSRSEKRGDKKQSRSDFSRALNNEDEVGIDDCVWVVV